MDFILSKIISRPMSLILSDDQFDHGINEFSSDQANRKIVCSTRCVSTSIKHRKMQLKKYRRKTKNLKKELKIIIRKSMKAGNVRAPKRSGSQENGDKCDASEQEENKVINLKETILDADLSATKLKDPENESIKVAENCKSTILPDIVNVQPVININSNSNNSNDDSLLASLASTLSNLKIASPSGNSNLTVPNTTFDAHSGFSSDDELFAECQTFTDPFPIDNENVDHSAQWNNVLSSMSSQHDESLENIVEQTDCDLHTETQIKAVELNVTQNTESLQTPINPVLVQEEKTVEQTSLEITAKEVLTNENCDPTLLENPKTALENIITVNENFNQRIREPTPKKTNSPEKEIILNLNETVELKGRPLAVSSADTSSENYHQLNNSNDVTSTTPNVLESTYNTPDTSSKSDPSEILPNNSGHLNTTFARSTEELSSFENSSRMVQNSTFDGNQLNGTFELKSTEAENLPSDKSSTLNDSSIINNTSTMVKSSVENDNLLFAVKENDESHVDSTANRIENKNKHDKTMQNTETQALDRSTKQKLTIKKDLFIDFVGDNSRDNLNGASPKKPIRSTNEKDFFVENFITENIDVTFKTPSAPAPFAGRRSNSHEKQEFTEDEFRPSNEIILSPSHFDFLLSKGNNNQEEVDKRSSLLLRFDPLLGYSVPVNNTSLNNNSNIEENSSEIYNKPLTPTKEEDDIEVNNQTQTLIDIPSNNDQEVLNLNITTPVGCDISPKPKPAEQVPPLVENKNSDRILPVTHIKTEINSPQPSVTKKDVKMSVDVIHDIKLENDVKSIENIDSHTDEKQNYKMAEFEKKFKNDALKTEEIEKKLKEAEAREEALLKRITEKDKTIGKMSGVLEAYEKAIAELIAEKEQIIQKYEKQLAEIKSDRDLNYQHLTSLEMTFSDLHAKYERSKQTGLTLKANVESLMSEKEKTIGNLKLQEQRYEKMKNHALQQLEIANNKLDTLTKNHTSEVTKLKALLKKEEISRLSINEQLQQKSRENEELMKICDELINGQGS